MAQVSNEVVTAFTFSGSINPLEKYQSVFKNSMKIATAGLGVMAASTGAMFAFMNSSLQTVDALGQLSQEAGVSIAWLQEMGYTASVNGSSIDSLQNSVRGLSSKIGEASIKGNEDFSRLGISVRNVDGSVKSTEKVFDELRFSFQRLSKAEQFNYAEKLGIDKSLLQLMRLNNAELEGLRGKLRKLNLSEAQKKDVVAYNDSFTTLTSTFSKLREQVGARLAPQLKMMNEKITDFLLKHSEKLISGLKSIILFFKKTAEIIVKVGKVIVDSAKGMIEFFKIGIGAKLMIGAIALKLIGLSSAIALVRGAILLLSKAIRLIPGVAIVTAIILAFEDLYAFFQGRPSITALVFDGIKERWRQLKEIFKDIVNWITDFLEPVLKPIKQVVDFIKGDDQTDEEKEAKRVSVQKAIDAGIIEGVPSRPSTSQDKKEVSESMQKMIDAGVIRGVTSKQLISQNQNNNISINISTNNPEAAGKSTQKHLERYINNANAQFSNNGVVRGGV